MTSAWLTANDAFVESDLSGGSLLEYENGEHTPSPSSSSILEPIQTSTPLLCSSSFADCLPATASTSTTEPPAVGDKLRPAFCLFVASLAAHLSEDQLFFSVKQHFHQYGKILTIKVLRDPRNRPYAFVHYGNQQDFDNALANGHRSLLDAHEIRCEPARVNRTVLICSYFANQKISFGSITSLALKYGQIENMTPFNGSGSEGMFVRFAYREDAAQAFSGLQEETPFRIYWVQNVSEESSNTKCAFDPKQVFVGQIASDVTELDLIEKFSGFGDILKVEITPNKINRTNCSAFVTFKTNMEAVQAVERLNHTMWMGRTLHVQIRRYHTKVRPQLAPPPNHSSSGPKRMLQEPFMKPSQSRNHQTTARTTSYANRKWKSGHAPAKENQYPKPKDQDVYPVYYYQMPWNSYAPQPAYNVAPSMDHRMAVHPPQRQHHNQQYQQQQQRNHRHQNRSCWAD